MTKNIIIFALVALAACGNITPSGDITAVNTSASSGLEGGSNTGAANLSLLTTCTDGQVLKWNDGSSLWYCGSAGGDVTQSLTTGGTVAALGVNADTTLLYWNPSSNPTLQGITNGAAGRRFKMVITDGDVVTVQYEAGAATAADRITVGDGLDWQFRGPTVVEFAYDSVTSRWTYGPVTMRFPILSTTGGITSGGAITDTGNRVFSIAGNGLTSSGATVDVVCGNGLTCNANDITLNMATGEVVQTTTATGTQSDFAINANTTVLKFTGTANLTLTGMAVSGGNVDGRTIKILNASTNNSTITFTNNATSTVGNRFRTAPSGFDVAIAGYTSTMATYDSTSTTWNISKETSGTAGRLALWGDVSGLLTSIIADNGSTATVNGALNTTGNITENSVRVFTVAGSGLTSSGGTVNAICTTNSLTCNADSIELASRDFTDITTSTNGTVMTIDNDVVTYAKMQNVSATSRIMCRKTAGAGDMEECTASDANTILGTPTGSGTSGTLAKWTGTNTLGNSIVTESGTAISVAGSLSTTGANGNLLVSREAYFGSANQVYITFADTASLNFEYGTNATATGYINNRGYQGGTTQTRSLGIADGTGTTSTDLIVFFDGTNRSTLFYQDVTMGDATTDQVVVAGDLTVNDDTTLTDQLQVQGHTTLGNGAVDVVAFNNSEPKDVGTVPSTGAMTCGTSPTVTGGRFSFNVHTGTGLASTCVIPFSTAFAATPTCTVSAESKVAAVSVSALSTSSISVTEGTGGDISDADIYIICIGH